MEASASPDRNGDQELSRMVNRVVEAAAELYEKKGRAATVDEIAKVAGISPPVTYQFVKKPADIMKLIMERVQTKFAAGVQEAVEPDAPALDQLLEAMAQYFRVVDEEGGQVVLVYRESRTLDTPGRQRLMALEMEAVAVFKAILEAGVAGGEFKTMDTDLAAYNIIMAGHAWALKAWHFKRRQMGFESYLQRQQDLMARMVRG